MAWCRSRGFKCGGNPFYVGLDSVWYNGEFMPHDRAIFLHRQEMKDSLSHVLPVSDSLPLKSVSIEYLEIGKSTADRLGFDYSEYIGRADFFSYDDLFSVTIQARNIGDTTFVYRSYTTLYDSTLSVFWGGQRDRLTQSNITSNGVVSNNYTQEKYGLDFRIDNLKYTYSHSSDYEHSINGSGKLNYGRNVIIGNYQYTYLKNSYIPFFGKIPVLGFFFTHETEITETRYIIILVYVMDYLEDLENG